MLLLGLVLNLVCVVVVLFCVVFGWFVLCLVGCDSSLDSCAV